MGDCLTKVQRSQELPIQIITEVVAKPLIYSTKQQLVMPTNKESLMPKYSSVTLITKENSPTVTDNIDNDADIPLITLKDLLQSNEGASLHQWGYHNVESVIYRLSKKKSKKESQEGSSHKKLKSSIIKNAQETQNIEGAINSNDIFSSLSLSINKMDVEFILPNCRAGPLVVPYINYGSYSR